MNLSPLTAIGPVDGRYRRKTACLSGFFSEYALIRHRVLVEIEWLKLLSRTDGVAGARPLSHAALAFLDALAADFSEKDAARVKEIEADINHDVKAVEYYLKEQCRNNPELLDTAHFLHFACTSEDINSMAWGLMLKGARAEVLLPRLAAIHDALQARALETARQLAPGVELTPAEASDIPFGDDFFDVVFTSGVLIHISPENIARAIREIHRCSGRYIWGYEYFSADYTPIRYRGRDGLMWKANFPKLYLDEFADLKLVKERKIRYRDSDNRDIMFLLEKTGAAGR